MKCDGTCFIVHVLFPFKTKKSRSNPVVVVQLVNRDLRNLIYHRKKELKEFCNISITEHLIEANIKLVKQVKSAEVFDSVWTFEGKIFGFIGKKRTLISSASDIPEGPKEKRPPPQV